jgi:hypothetical protein
LRYEMTLKEMAGCKTGAPAARPKSKGKRGLQALAALGRKKKAG